MNIATHLTFITSNLIYLYSYHIITLNHNPWIPTKQMFLTVKSIFYFRSLGKQTNQEEGQPGPNH
jgi:hypothetical protein